MLLKLYLNLCYEPFFYSLMHITLDGILMTTITIYIILDLLNIFIQWKTNLKVG